MQTEKRPTVYERWIKRGIDILLSLIGLAAFFWLGLIVAAAIWLDDPGPVLFGQERIGKDKKHFQLHKFRSMKLSAPKDLPTHLFVDAEQYVTRVGRVLRKFSLDELPQLWDILVGNMSLIGPRPALWNQDDLVAERDRYGANNVRPGLTGWAQINGRDELEIPEKARLDGVYTEALRKSSASGLTMDARCFFHTFASVLRHEGFVEGGTGAIKPQDKGDGRDD